MLKKARRVLGAVAVSTALVTGCASPLHELREPARRASNFHDSHATLRGFVHSGNPHFDVEVGYKLPKRAPHGKGVAEAYASSDFSKGMATDLYVKRQKVKTGELDSEFMREAKRNPYLRSFLNGVTRVEKFEHGGGSGVHVVTENDGHIYVYMRPKKPGQQVRPSDLVWLLEQTRQAALLHVRAEEVNGILRVIQTSQ